MKWVREKMDLGDIPPPTIVRNLLKTVAPLSYAIARNPRSMVKNVGAWKRRLRAGMAPWKHLEDESEYSSTRMLEIEDFDSLPDVSREKYLRPTRLCQCDNKNIRALARKFGAGEISNEEYLRRIYYFVKNQKYLIFKPMGGATGTLKSKGGVCLDQMSLFIALARAAGIKARYRLYAFTPVDELVDVMLKDDPVLMETYQMLGFLDSLHGCAEFYIGGRWIQLDPTFSDYLEAGMGLPISNFNEPPSWGVRVPDRDIIMEGLPRGLNASLVSLALLLRNTVDEVNKKLDEIREKGKEILEEIGVEEYNRRLKRKGAAIKLPDVDEVRKFREKMALEKIS